MKLPSALAKIERKHWFGVSLLAVVALGAFAVGSLRGTPSEQAGHGAGKEPATDTHGKTRIPAGTAPAPEKDSSPSDDDGAYEEEVEVQVAHAPAIHGEKALAAHGEKAVVVRPSSAKGLEPQLGTFEKLTGFYKDAWRSANAKVQALYHAEEENRKLRMENSYLRVTVESQRYSCRTVEAEKKTDTVGKKLATEAGSKAARSLVSIRYRFPENLQPEQLHALGVSYFKVKDDEKAAVILHFLTELEDDKSYKTAPNYLMTGIAFYRLDNYKYAGEYFEKVVAATATDEDTVNAKRQAKYWKALVAERLKDPKTAQKLILESLEQNPQTKEAFWVNPQASADRAPASTKGSHEGPSPKH